MRNSSYICNVLLIACCALAQVSCSSKNDDKDGDLFQDDDSNDLGQAVDQKTTANPNQPFSKFELADLLYTNNVYDWRARLPDDPNQLFYSDGVQDFVTWNIPAAQVLDDGRNSCGVPQGDDDIVLDYRITSYKDSDIRYFFVRAFPAMVLGTMGGRYESWGIECGNDTEITTDYGRKQSPAFDMIPINNITGFPTAVSDMPEDVKISVKADINSGKATNGVANVFLDSYWHDVSTIEKLPGQDAQWLNTINGINSDFTETWNLNIWFDWTNINNRTIREWTGGILLGSVQISGNPEFDIYLKAEGNRDNYLPTCRIGDEDNCFMYIALAVKDRQLTPAGVTINYSEIANWMRSADFRDLFLDGADIQGTNDPSAIAYEIWRTIDGPENDSHPDAAKRGPRFPDLDYVIGGLHLGSEIWFNPQGQPAQLGFETLGVKVNGFGTFGRYVDYTQ